MGDVYDPVTDAENQDEELTQSVIRTGHKYDIDNASAFKLLLQATIGHQSYVIIGPYEPYHRNQIAGHIYMTIAHDHQYIQNHPFEFDKPTT